jgi:cbb3-type cytochrome oxidase subunit 3
VEFLDAYGKSDLLYERIVKGFFIALLALILLGCVYYLFFRNWREEAQARRFLNLVQAHEYSEAYKMFNCSIEEPCRYYPYGEFLEDWGEQSEVGEIRSFDLGRSFTQSGGVILLYEINGVAQDPLWVDRTTGIVGFAPH